MEKNSCKRCDGKGFILQVAHVRGGVCFKCDGLGRPLTSAELSAMASRDGRRRVAELASERAEAERLRAAVAAAPAGWMRRADEGALAKALERVAFIEAELGQ